MSWFTYDKSLILISGGVLIGFYLETRRAQRSKYIFPNVFFRVTLLYSVPPKNSLPIIGLWNRRSLKVLNKSKLILCEHKFFTANCRIHLGSIWYHSVPSEVPYSTN